MTKQPTVATPWEYKDGYYLRRSDMGRENEIESRLDIRSIFPRSEV